MTLEITKERILEAASKCSTAKETLKTLFPEVFEEDKYFDFSKTEMQILKGRTLPSGFEQEMLEVRTYGKYAYKGFYLSPSLNWEIVVDDKGGSVLLPTTKV